MVAEQPTLFTDRLLLRPFELVDAPRLQELAGVREVADTTLNIPHPYPDGAASLWIASHVPAWLDQTGVTFAITDRMIGDLMGAIGLVCNTSHASGELGYWVAKEHWKRGYCTEAARAVLAFAFDSLDLHRVHATHFVRNPASGRVMQKLGMQFEGIRRGAVRKNGVFEDLATYAILRDDP